MERNLLASLARGEVVPGRKELERVGPPQEPLYNNRGDVGKSRVRTLSAVNEHWLAQLSMQERATTAPNNNNSNNNNHQRGHAAQQQQHHQLQSPSSPIQGRPPLPSRPPQPQSKLTTTAPACSNNGSSNSQNGTSNGNGSGNGNHIPSFHAMDSLELSPDPTESKKGPAADTDKLRGIDLLDHAELSSSPEAEYKPSNASANKTSSSTTNNNTNSPKRPPALHVRSHTAGGAVHTSMEQPDIDATINCVCSVYRAHIETALSQSTAAAAVPMQQPPHTARINLDVFRDDFEYRQQHQHGRSRSNKKPAVMPSVATIQKFYKEFYQRSQMEHDTIIMSLIYVERLMKMTHGALQPTPENWGSVLISCMILASKVWGACVCFVVQWMIILCA